MSSSFELKLKIKQVGISAGNAIIIIGFDLVNITVAGFDGLGVHQRRRRLAGTWASDQNISDSQKIDWTIWAVGFNL